jgi:hypothetical protein
MKNPLLSFILLGIGLLLTVSTLMGEEKSNEAVLNGIDAFQAMEIANEWKWTKEEIKSSVHPRAIVFKLTDEKTIRIPLPEKKMVVAVAPYIKETHG